MSFPSSGNANAIDSALRPVKVPISSTFLVLDIFAGSGTTGRAARHLNRSYILCDINSNGKDIFLESIEE